MVKKPKQNIATKNSQNKRGRKKGQREKDIENKAIRLQPW